MTAESLLGTQQCVFEEVLRMDLLIANSLISNALLYNPINNAINDQHLVLFLCLINHKSTFLDIAYSIQLYTILSQTSILSSSILLSI